MDKETADKMRGMIRRCAIKNLRDDGETQRCSVEIADGIWHDDVEVFQFYGQAGHVPEDGALGLVVAIGGDQGDLLVIGISNPSKRMGGMNAGDVGMYNQHGDKLVQRSGGGTTMESGGTITLTAGGGGHLD